VRSARTKRPSASTPDLARIPKDPGPIGRARSRHKRRLPWGSAPFDGINDRDRYRAGLPRRHPPLSGFLTLSAASSPGRLVALFHATSVHRLSAFRASPVRPAVASLDARCSLAVGERRKLRANPARAAYHSASEPCSGRTSVTRPDGVSVGRAAALLAFLLSEVYRTRRPDNVLPSRASSPPMVAKWVQGTTEDQLRLRVSTIEPGSDSEESLQPP